MSKRQFSFVQLDVFTSRPLEGNQLAVFTDARGLSDDEMQKLARETNLCETTFILPRDAATERGEGHKVRIFTINEELPFAGHPTLGTAWYLRQQSSADEVVLDLKVGKIPVRFEQRDGLLFGEMRQAEPQFGGAHPHDVVAGVLGVPVSICDESLRSRPSRPACRSPRAVPLAGRAAEAHHRLEPDGALSGDIGIRLSSTSSAARPSIPNATLHARMIFYNGEDPATGSAAGCCTAWAVNMACSRPRLRA